MTRALVARLHALLETPDPAELRGRGARVTHPGRVDRFERVYLPLLKRWAVTRQLDTRGDLPLVRRTRTGHLLGFLTKRTAA